MANTYCPCPYTGPFGNLLDCDKKLKASLLCLFKVVCVSDFLGETKSDPDPLDPLSGALTNYELNVGADAIDFLVDENSASFNQLVTQPDSTTNTNGTLEGTGAFTLINYNWLCENLGKTFDIFFWDNNGRLFKATYKLEEYEMTIEANPDDGVINARWKFTNVNKYNKFCFVDVTQNDPLIYTTNLEFFESLN